ncbi:MAG: hypothetical protein L0196_08350 [candidate division Zixibacteria bacterium]|nr:hypothetical protein [candidate division Zixibacteria bacterium]
MSPRRPEAVERLAQQAERFLVNWAAGEKEGLKTFKRIWRLKELAYRPIEEFPDLAERFRLFEKWLGDEGLELASSPLTRYQMEEVSAALEKLKLFLPRTSESASEAAASDQLSQLAEKFVARLQRPETFPPTLSSEAAIPPAEGEGPGGRLSDGGLASPDSPPPASLDRLPSTSLGASRDKPLGTPRLPSISFPRPSSEQVGTSRSEQASRDLPESKGDLGEDFKKLLGYELAYMEQYRRPGEHPLSVIGRLLDALSARYHLADEVFVAHLLYFLQAQNYPVGPYLEKFRQIKSRVKK